MTSRIVLNETTPETEYINLLTRFVNGLWTAYEMGQTYLDWLQTTLESSEIMTNKCAALIPNATLRIAFIDAYRIVNNHERINSQ